MKTWNTATKIHRTPHHTTTIACISSKNGSKRNRRTWSGKGGGLPADVQNVEDPTLGNEIIRSPLQRLMAVLTGVDRDNHKPPGALRRLRRISPHLRPSEIRQGQRGNDRRGCEEGGGSGRGSSRAAMVAEIRVLPVVDVGVEGDRETGGGGRKRRSVVFG